jgi:membrane-associated phospholipid phosphatase
MSFLLFSPAWAVITRLGEAQILLPTALLLALWFAWRGHSQRLAASWLFGIAAATFVTTASKVAFMGYGLGWQAMDFTGISGHAMFAAAIYPLAGTAVVSAVAGPHAVRWQWLGLSVGVAVALLVATSRVAVQAHSVSEIVAGLLIGGGATALALRAGRLPLAKPPLWLPLAVALWLGISPAHAPPSTTHDWVTRLSLKVSGHSRPYTRYDLHAGAAVPGRYSTLARPAGTLLR